MDHLVGHEIQYTKRDEDCDDYCIKEVGMEMFRKNKFRLKMDKFPSEVLSLVKDIRAEHNKLKISFYLGESTLNFFKSIEPGLCVGDCFIELLNSKCKAVVYQKFTNCRVNVDWFSLCFDIDDSGNNVIVVNCDFGTFCVDFPGKYHYSSPYDSWV